MDLRVIKILDVLPITRVDLADYSPQTLALSGRSFQYTQSVFVNDLSMPLRTTAAFGYTVISPNLIHVELPAAMSDQVISKIIVLGNTSILYETSSIEFSLVSITPVQGISGVVQQFLKLFLTTPGTDLFNRSSGGGIKNMAGITLNDPARQGIAVKLMVAAKKCTEEIRASQSICTSIPPEERLVDVAIGSVSFREESGDAEIELEFETEAQRAIIKVGV